MGTELNAFRKVVHRASQILGNKIADAVTKSSNDKIVKPDENPRNIEEIIIPLEKRDWILNKLRKMELYKISNLSNDSTVSKLWQKMTEVKTVTKNDQSKWFIEWSIFCQQKY